MTDRVAPVGKVERRTGDRRDTRTDRRDGVTPPARDLVPTDFEPTPEVEPARHAPPRTDAASAVFAAQVLGQSGQRRGLKGGPPVLDGARSTYLGNEFSGAKERRPPKGGVGDTEV